MSYRAILFDLDGTLLDTLDDLAESGNLALAQLGFPTHPREAYKYFVGDGVETLMRRALPPDRLDAATLHQGTALMRQAYAERWAHKTQPYPGIPALLDALTALALPLTVLSNKPHQFTQLCVERLLPRWTFAAVVGAQPTMPRKPDPSGARAIATGLGVSPADMLYLGDTNTDMQTAVAAGMYPVGVLWGFRSPDELRASGAQTLLAQPLELLGLL
jgi:phosphoglycolate phosphatase